MEIAGWTVLNSLGKRLQWGHGITAVEIASCIAKRGAFYTLQWGHGITAVEMPHEEMMVVHLDALQWGHGITAVEIARPVPGIQLSARFNGATASLPWK